MLREHSKRHYMLTFSIGLGLAVVAAVLVPSKIAAVCNFGDCTVPNGYCSGGICDNPWEFQDQYYDQDCDGGLTLCEHDICWFFDYVQGTCPESVSCFNSDKWFCNGQGATCEELCRGNPSCICDCMGGTMDEGGACTFSPLIVNLRSNTSNDQLTPAQDGVFFDINADGARDHVAWTKPNEPVGFLALDRNANGIVDDGSELFGTATIKRDGTRALNGFEALADFDENGDARIDSSDAAYDRLLVWVDANHDGHSQPFELQTLSQAGIVSISTQYKESERIDRYGNRYRFAGSAFFSKMGPEIEHRLFDVFLQRTQ